MLLNSIIYIFLSKWKSRSGVGKQEHVMNREIFSNQIITPILSGKLLDFSLSEPESPVYCIMSIVYKMQIQSIFI